MINYKNLKKFFLELRKRNEKKYVSSTINKSYVVKQWFVNMIQYFFDPVHSKSVLNLEIDLASNLTNGV